MAGIAVRHPEIVEVGRHYGMAIAPVPADPQTKGGSKATVRIAKADLVPTEADLLGTYRSVGQLETAVEILRESATPRFVMVLLGGTVTPPLHAPAVCARPA